MIVDQPPMSPIPPETSASGGLGDIEERRGASPLCTPRWAARTKRSLLVIHDHCQTPGGVPLHHSVSLGARCRRPGTPHKTLARRFLLHLFFARFSTSGLAHSAKGCGQPLGPPRADQKGRTWEMPDSSHQQSPVYHRSSTFQTLQCRNRVPHKTHLTIRNRLW